MLSFGNQYAGLNASSDIAWHSSGVEISYSLTTTSRGPGAVLAAPELKAAYCLGQLGTQQALVAPPWRT